jgi:hypothetical protein
MNTTESGADYIARMARGSKLLGERGRIAWSSVAMLVTADDLREAVARGLVRVEKVDAGNGRTVTHLISTNGEQA